MKPFPKILKTLLILFLIGLIGCTSRPKTPPTPPQAEQRDRLTFEKLTSQSDSGSRHVHNAYFMPIGDWKPALFELAGTLNVPETQMQTDIWKHRLFRSAPRSNLWEMVIEEVFIPIGIIHAPLRHTQEPDGSRGIPHFLAGFYPTPDDVAKITVLLQNGGEHRGKQLLSKAKLAQALYKTEKRGFPTGRHNGYGYGWYNMSFWPAPYRTQNGCFFQIPYMGGYGGNLVVLLPNGIKPCKSKIANS